MIMFFLDYFRHYERNGMDATAQKARLAEIIAEEEADDIARAILKRAFIGVAREVGAGFVIQTSHR